jgi:hypothetical protein
MSGFDPIADISLSTASLSFFVYTSGNLASAMRPRIGRANKLFTDGEVCERLMGRWSRLAGESFLDYRLLERVCDGSILAVVMAPSLRSLLPTVLPPP